MVSYNFKIYMKINIKTAPTCFGVVTPSSGSTLHHNALPDDGVLQRILKVTWKLTLKQLWHVSV